MNGHVRVKSPLTQLGIFLGLFGAAFIVASMVMAIVVVLTGIPAGALGKLDWSDPKVLPAMKLLQGISSVLIFLVPAIAFALMVYRGKPLYFLGLRPVSRPATYLLAIAAVILAFPFVMWLGEINQALPLPQWMISMEKEAMQQMMAFLKARNTTDVLINVFLIALLPAICEEICFRGALQRVVIQISRNPWLGIVLTSIIFSALHLQFQGFLPRMFLGVVLGAIYWYSGSLWPSILAHFVNNAVQVVGVSYAPQYIDTNPSIPVAGALASGMAVWGVMWIFRSLSTANYAKEYSSGDPDNQFLA